jgi:hypothetical protein
VSTLNEIRDQVINASARKILYVIKLSFVKKEHEGSAAEYVGEGHRKGGQST